MADQDEEDLKMALRMSMQHESPEPKRSKPRENAAGGAPAEESPDANKRRLQRELMAAAAERRMMAVQSGAGASASPSLKVEKNVESIRKEAKASGSGAEFRTIEVSMGKELSENEANQLFFMMFGGDVTHDILAQWSNQGIRFSPDPETSMGLVQHEGGPCGVLAAIQAYVLKYLLFLPGELSRVAPNVLTDLDSMRLSRSEHSASDIFVSLTEDQKARALVRSMGEILFLCGGNKRVVIASLNILDRDNGVPDGSSMDEIVAKALEGLSVESGSNLQKVLRVTTYTSQQSAFQRLEAMIPAFRSRMGAMLFLISALLSRGLDLIQADRDDPSLPLVTAPFGHASQEIVNLLLCGQAVANVFDGNMDLGGGMFVKGIRTPVEVGFLTLLESLNFCKVGQHLKSPKWPIWVVGSESHYTVLFALDPKVQHENELEGRETQIRRAFDARDQSGGGGFIDADAFRQVLMETKIDLPPEKLDRLAGSGIIVWSEFWQVLLDLDRGLGGLKDTTGSMGKKVFDLYHFNGIAKSVASSSSSPSMQRPRLTRLKVSVPPRWTPEEFVEPAAATAAAGEVSKPEPSLHAPLVDCIRTRWARAVCRCEGDAPSIV